MSRITPNPVLVMAIAGAHRTGKTTLRTALAEQGQSQRFMELNFSVTEAWYQTGWLKNRKPSMDLSPLERINFQIGCLEYWHRQMDVGIKEAEAGGYQVLVMDRSPVDFITYTRMELANCLDEEVLVAYANFEACILKSLRRLDILMTLPPTLHLVNEGKPMPEEVGKFNARNSLLNQRLYHDLMMGFLDTNKVSLLGVTVYHALKLALDVEDRMQEVGTALLRYEEELARYQYARQEQQRLDELCGARRESGVTIVAGEV